MVIFHDPRCAEYGSSMRPEQPARVISSAGHLRRHHADWSWRQPTEADEAALLRAHTPAHLARVEQARDFDSDTPFFPGIAAHARRAAGSAIGAAEWAYTTGQAAFSLMRPPGHHATSSQAMGFCYLNSIAIAALDAVERLGVKRLAVWDFDAHHGNGTEAILRGRSNFLFSSVHQFPGYPGTGTRSFENCRNWPVPPETPASQHLAALRESFDAVIAFKPELILVSAGFDAYVDDPITDMTLEISDFETLGRWVGDSGVPTAAILEGGYSGDLALLIDAFLSAWKK